VDRSATHVAPIGLLAEATLEIALAVEHAVLEQRKYADRVLATLLRRRRDLAAPDHRFIVAATFALFRWRGWLEPLRLERPEARLLYSTMLDLPHVHPVCRHWARVLGDDPSRLHPLGDAPNWPARSEGFRRLVGIPAVTADPWRLFPPWLREHLPLPPGGSSPKIRYVELLQILQSRSPLWVRVQGADEQKVWDELRGLGVKPWIHRHQLRAAKLDADVDIYHLPPFTRGDLEIQDLASQAVGLACDPDPGERWWDVCAGAGGKALHLSALMRGKGLVVATDVHEHKLEETVRRARRSPFRNLSTKPWDGRHVPGKAASFDGVLVDAPCSAIGTWRRNPDARWTLDRHAVARLAELQGSILSAAAPGVRPGGTLVYSVCTLSVTETTTVVRAFLERHPEFRLEPFAHPLTDAPTDGMLQIWPQDADSDAMFMARMVRSAVPKIKSAKKSRVVEPVAVDVAASLPVANSEGALGDG
jgi:16S rRNA (cytosine967-C5)-methyltransferase